MDLSRQDEVFILTLGDDENRWNTNFVREFGKALDEVEASTGPAHLLKNAAKFR